MLTIYISSPPPSLYSPTLHAFWHTASSVIFYVNFQDIAGSKAYVQAIEKLKIVSAEECKLILEGLCKVETEWAAGTFEIKPGDEDIHTVRACFCRRCPPLS